jgi:vacuolar-type H+-ATPase subunit E/Vma4
VAEEHLERLLVELGARASTELEQVRSDADGLAAQILSDADARVDARRDNALATCEADYARRRAAAAAGARHDSRAALLRAQHAFVETVIGRARAIVVERLDREGDTPAIAARVAELSSYAEDGTITRRDGLVLTTNRGLVIDDSVDAWLDGEREQIAIDLCRAVEAT